MGTCITLVGTGTGGTENNIANIDVPLDGNLIGIDWSVYADLDADGESARYEVSFASSNGIGSNDLRASISQVAMWASMTTSGQAQHSVNKFVALPDIPVAGGERIYLHAIASAGVAAGVACVLHFDFDLNRPLPRRR